MMVTAQGRRHSHFRRRVAALGIAAVLAVPAAVAVSVTAGSTAKAQSCPWVTSTAPIQQRVAQLLSNMTLDDKISMVEGHGTSNAYVFYTPAITSLCIPQLGLEDGPAGVADGNTDVTELPAGVSLAATWDTQLADSYGKVVGAEEYSKGAAANLGPTVNIDRDPRWGRSFESLSEDPYLTSEIGDNEIDGVQSQDVMSQVKHYTDYGQETYRNTPADNNIVSDRALEEIYNPPFQSAVSDSDVASIMCAYSYVNNSASCNSSYLLTDVLRNLYDFQGFVMSDYGALHGTAGALEGTDSEQPFNTNYGAPLENDIEAGVIPVSALNTMVSSILTQMFRFNFFANPNPNNTTDSATTPAHVTLSNEIAEDGTTLLKNNNTTLPLSKSENVAVIGPAASASVTSAGGGSAYVIPSSATSPLAGIQADDSNVTYTQGLPTDTSLAAIPSADLSPAYAATPFGGSYTGTLTAPETGTYVLAITNDCGCYTPTYLSLNGTQLIDDPSTPPVHTYSVAVNLTEGTTYTVGISGDSDQLLWATPSDLSPYISAAVSAAKSAKVAVVVVSDDTESEATDRLSLSLPSAQDELIEAVAAANPDTVVVVDAGAPVTMPWLSDVSSVVDAWYPGQTNGTALASVLFGNTDPSGHLPVTFPQSLSQVSDANPAEFPGDGSEVFQNDGIDVGYRWFEVKNETPLFPFGYGLSYTNFSFSHLRIDNTKVTGTDNVRVSATITNTGTVSGSDVAQIYLGDPAASGEPSRQLEGFQRVTLAPGQSKQLTFTITPQQESWWSDSANGWTQTAGTYRVYVGDSSALANLPLRATYDVTSTPGARQVVMSGPGKAKPGKAFEVRVTLTGGGNETLHNVRLALQLPAGWKATPVSKTVFATVGPDQAPVATFEVTPPSYSPSLSATVHATATLGAITREAGITTTVS
jgi:beta-glucosidase